MPATPLDSQIYGQLFGDPDIGKLLTDSAEIRAMLIVEGALAKAQAGLGMIPAEAAEAIHRATMEVVIDPTSLRAPTASNAVPVPALVAEFRKAMADKEAAAFAHWGATSQDIADTGLALRLRQVFGVYEERLGEALAALADASGRHRSLPMAARTWAVPATPTSLGAVMASWGNPLLRYRDRLVALKPRLLAVSLSGAAGTLSAMGPDGPEVRAELAAALDLEDPGQSTHSTRDHIAELAAWCAGLTGSLAKMGEDVLSMVRTGEARLTMGGASSTMPQKQNPVAPMVIVAMARQVAALSGAITSALPHRDQRDGTAWMVEWLSLSQMLILTGRALSLAAEIAPAVTPDEEAMARAIDDGSGLIYAEALSFALARHMPRPEAQAKVKELCLQARALPSSLPALAAREWPEHDFAGLFKPEAQLGDAPSEADRFVAAVRGR